MILIWIEKLALTWAISAKTFINVNGFSPNQTVL